ncbi:MAG: hypothetical protein ACFFD1_01690, partial [Candidatus Thorarchaeota archaeon]
MPGPKKISVEELRGSLEELIAPFSPVELKIKSNKLFVSELSMKAYHDSLELVAKAEKNKLLLPESSVNLARYGPAIIKITDNYNDYIIMKSIKKLSRSKGSHRFEIPTWDKRIIDAELKKTKKIKVKMKEDEKLFYEFISPFSHILNDKNQIILQMEKNFGAFAELFTNPLADTYQSVNKGKMTFIEYETNKESIKKSKNDLNNLNITIEQLQKEKQDLEQELNTYWNKFYQTSTGSLYSHKNSEIHRHLTSAPLNSYAEIIKELASSFDVYIQKQQIQITDEFSDLLKKMVNSISEPIENLSNIFPNFIDFYLMYVEEVFGKKLKKKPEYSDKAFLIDSPGWKAWLEEQEYANDLDELKQTNEYKAFINEIRELQAKKDDIEKKLKENIEKKKNLELSLEELEKHNENLVNQLIQ